MEHIDIPETLIQYFRKLDHEEQGTFFIQDSKISKYKELYNYSTDANYVYGFFSDNVDGIIHNHLHDNSFSIEDLDNMIPEYIYVLITPNELFAMKNKEMLLCDSL